MTKKKNIKRGVLPVTDNNIATLDDLVREYPKVLTAEAIGRFLHKDAQDVRNMAKKGLYPFAIVDVGRNRSNYTFPTGRFVAWFEGRL